MIVSFPHRRTGKSSNQPLQTNFLNTGFAGAGICDDGDYQPSSLIVAARVEQFPFSCVEYPIHLTGYDADGRLHSGALHLDLEK